MRVQVSPQISARDQGRQSGAARRFDLAPVFAKLLRNPGQTDARVDELLGLTSVARFPAEDAVFVDLEAVLLTKAAQCHVAPSSR